jgi:hypothetical protein
MNALREIHAGHGAYPLEEALDDIVIDLHLEKLRYWRTNPLTSPRSAVGKALLSTLSRAAG